MAAGKVLAAASAAAREDLVEMAGQDGMVLVVQAEVGLRVGIATVNPFA